MAIDRALCKKFGWKYDETRAKLIRAGLLLIGFKKELANVDTDKWLTESFKNKIIEMSCMSVPTSISSNSFNTLS